MEQPLDPAVGFDLNLRAVTPMGTGMLYQLRCGCYQRRDASGRVYEADYCWPHLGELTRMVHEP